ncbi:hypothetical protein H8356DRAFT_1323417 [Neocallimastix lanati (nom. inval.)]|nr:hypothetical protein H8356DRAFT_1323417 [Neocallimastix sp. JGI-2020a]
MLEILSIPPIAGICAALQIKSFAKWKSRTLYKNIKKYKCEKYDDILERYWKNQFPNLKVLKVKTKTTIVTRFFSWIIRFNTVVYKYNTLLVFAIRMGSTIPSISNIPKLPNLTKSVDVDVDHQSISTKGKYHLTMDTTLSILKIFKDVTFRGLYWSYGFKSRNSYVSIYDITRELRISPLSAVFAISQLHCFRKRKWKNPSFNDGEQRQLVDNIFKQSSTSSTVPYFVGIAEFLNKCNTFNFVDVEMIRHEFSPPGERSYTDSMDNTNTEIITGNNGHVFYHRGMGKVRGYCF